MAGGAAGWCTCAPPPRTAAMRAHLPVGVVWGAWACSGACALPQACNISNRMLNGAASSCYQFAKSGCVPARTALSRLPRRSLAPRAPPMPPAERGARDGPLSAGWRWLDRALQAAFFAEGATLQRACAVLLILHAAWLAAKAAT